MSIHTYVVMGINTAFLQATLMSKGKVYTNIPAEVQVKMNMVKGNFKFEFLPVEGIDKIASAQYVIFLNQKSPPFVTLTGNPLPGRFETYAVARNVEDLAAAKMTPIVPNHINLEMKKSSQKISSDVSLIHHLFHKKVKKRQKHLHETNSVFLLWFIDHCIICNALQQRARFKPKSNHQGL